MRKSWSRWIKFSHHMSEGVLRMRLAKGVKIGNKGSKEATKKNWNGSKCIKLGQHLQKWVNYVEFDQSGKIPCRETLIQYHLYQIIFGRVGPKKIVKGVQTFLFELGFQNIYITYILFLFLFFGDTFCRTQEGPAYTWLFNFHTFARSFARLLVRPSVSEIKFWSLHIH